jgi:uncharacterized repeat protein (TIGR03803 family)
LKTLCAASLGLLALSASTPRVQAQQLVTLHTFGGTLSGGGADLSSPYLNPPVYNSTDGYLYGTAQTGGSAGYGGIYKIKPDGTGYTVLYQFQGGTDGAWPLGQLAIDPSGNGNMYGVTVRAAYVQGSGAVYVFNAGTDTFTVLYTLAYDGSQGADPEDVIFGSDGVLYGSCLYGLYATNGGTVFSLNTDGSNFQSTYSDTFGVPLGTPQGPVISPSGAIYTVGTGETGAYPGGAVYEVSGGTSTLTVTTAAEFSSSTNQNPRGTPVFGANGLLYGNGVGGGALGLGGLWEFNPATDTLAGVYDFTGGVTDGSTPFGAMAVDSAGNLYTIAQGATNTLVLDEYNVASGTITTLASWFDPTTNQGNGYASLYIDSTGSLYAISPASGSNGLGALYKVVPPSITVKAVSGRHGSISPSGKVMVPTGNSVAFTAKPDTGFQVRRWRVDGQIVQVGGSTFTLSNVTTKHRVHVSFDDEQFTITASAGQYGSLDGNPTRTVDYGDSLTFTANPQARSTVDTWYVDGRAAQTGGNTFTLSDVTANHAVSVTFTAPWIKVNATAGNNGAINPSGDQEVSPGSSTTFTATPNPGYVVNAWSVEGTVQQIGGSSFTLSNVTADCHVKVTFSLMTFVLTPCAGANGTISPAAAQTVNYGDSKTYTAKPAKGHTVAAWQVDGVTVQTGGTTLTLTNITASHAISVTFN